LENQLRKKGKGPCGSVVLGLGIAFGSQTCPD